MVRSRFLMALFSVGLLCGCGTGQNGPQRAVLSGEVTYEGKVVPFGSIRFIPQAGSNLPAGGALIQDGRYEANNRGGVPVGTHRVEIEGWKFPLSDEGLADGGGQPNPQILPPRFNTKSELILVVETPDMKTYDFHLK